MEEKQLIKQSIKRSIEFYIRWVADYEEGITDDMESYYSAKENIIRLELDLENL